MRMQPTEPQAWRSPSELESERQLRDAPKSLVLIIDDDEGIRTALYFGLACGRELRAVLDGRRTREQALSRYGAFSAAHERKYRWLLGAQRAVGRITPSRALSGVVRAVENQRLASWIFEHYLAIAPPSFVDSGPRPTPRPMSRLAPAGAS